MAEKNVNYTIYTCDRCGARYDSRTGNMPSWRYVTLARWKSDVTDPLPTQPRPVWRLLCNDCLHEHEGWWHDQAPDRRPPGA